MSDWNPFADPADDNEDTADEAPLKQEDQIVKEDPKPTGGYPTSQKLDAVKTMSTSGSDMASEVEALIQLTSGKSAPAWKTASALATDLGRLKEDIVKGKTLSQDDMFKQINKMWNDNLKVIKELGSAKDAESIQLLEQAGKACNGVHQAIIQHLYKGWSSDVQIVFGDKVSPTQPQSTLKFRKEDLTPKWNAAKNSTVPKALVKTIFSTFAPADINWVQGNYYFKPESFPYPVGLHGVGIVTDVNQSAEEQCDLHPGDIVTSFMKASPDGKSLEEVFWHCSGQIIDARLLINIPKNFTMTESMMLCSANPATAYMMLMQFFDFEHKADTWIIQNGGNSNMGLTINRIAQKKGAKVISIVRSEASAKVCREMGAALVLVLKDGETIFSPIVREIKSKIGNATVPLALDCIGGTCAQLLLSVLSDGGKMVTYGGMSHQPIYVSTAQLLFERKELCGFIFWEYFLPGEPGAEKSWSESQIKEMFQFLKDMALKDGVISQGSDLGGRFIKPTEIPDIYKEGWTTMLQKTSFPKALIRW